ncbi:TPA: hypothetical protein ACGWER_001717 [Streptococcus agalactiae]|nr:hypothetical protein [Streptococcus agalactiae]
MKLKRLLGIVITLMTSVILVACTHAEDGKYYLLDGKDTGVKDNYKIDKNDYFTIKDGTLHGVSDGSYTEKVDYDNNELKDEKTGKVIAKYTHLSNDTMSINQDGNLLYYVKVGSSEYKKYNK